MAKLIYQPTGTHWDSRYKSSLVQADDCLLPCQRHIKLQRNSGYVRNFPSPNVYADAA